MLLQVQKLKIYMWYQLILTVANDNVLIGLCVEMTSIGVPFILYLS
jgi:hypothetical protein